ncbi:MAG: alpha/beta hydrolase [Marinilabiliales bacterium]|nr:MAG: alpha/beta hydrolase [Marinilabiliales bacterium]
MKYVVAFIMISLIISCNNFREFNEQSKTKKLQKEFKSFTQENPSGNGSFEEKYNKTLELWDIPFVELYIETNYGLTHIIVSGNKDSIPIVLLHGMNASSTMWYPNIKSFSNNNRVYAIDYILDAGKINSNAKIKTLEDLNNWFSEVLVHLDLGKVNLVGISQGGWQATLFTISSPDKINKLVLLSPAQALNWAKPGFDLVRNIIYNINPKRENTENLLKTLSVDVGGINPLFIDQFYASTKLTPFNEFTMKMQPFADEELNSIKVPVLLLVGDHDIFNDEESIERAKDVIKNVKCEIIKNSGHFLTFDQTEIVNEKVVSFLNSNEFNHN